MDDSKGAAQWAPTLRGAFHRHMESKSRFSPCKPFFHRSNDTDLWTLGCKDPKAGYHDESLPLLLLSLANRIDEPLTTLNSFSII